MTDPIADMLTRIRNALAVQHTEVAMPYSKMKHAIAKVLEDNGYVTSVTVADSPTRAARQVLTLTLRYRQPGNPSIASLRRVSRPGRRVYVSSRELPRVLNDLGIAVVSTSAGIMTNREARKRKLGGELICEIY
ncbi:MAG: 30S ribosomal protein S8 [Patescibacteria group bacterium]|nr:30S ribosomal protein S8 [Patescibacteria group bacterium]